MFCLSRCLFATKPTFFPIALVTQTRRMSVNSLKRSADTELLTNQPKPLKPKPELNETETETKLFDLLLDVVKDHNLNTTLRVAGGWVRDKLLGLQSDDIDVTMDDMTGAQFAEMVNKYLAKHDQKTGSIGVIKKNPEQSKHLETATVTIFDLSIDFVNLRSETYEADSRIPDKVSFGTAQQDAERRDITINALFYNLNYKIVEDLTGKGLSDLRDKIVRTPLPPSTTFKDDPLRVLRVVRFASRFDFEIHDDTKQALEDVEVQNALKSKVSKERIGIEVDKMLRGPNPSLSIELLVRTKLYNVIFYPQGQPTVSDEDNVIIHSLELKRGIAIWRDTFQEYFSLDEVRLLYFATALWPFCEKTFTEKNRTYPMVVQIIRDLLKLPTRDGTNIVLIHEMVPIWMSILTSPFSRKDLGLAVRKAGALWRASVLFTAILFTAILNQENLIKSIFHLIERVRSYDLDGCWDLKPLLDGAKIADLLNVPKGPKIGEELQKLMEWQLENPDKTGEDAEQWLLSKRK